VQDAPLARAPVRDDPEMAADPQENNHFDFSILSMGEPTDKFCPFATHSKDVASQS
jgi:hypothetical protein